MGELIGKPVPLIDSVDKVTGKQIYGSDFKLPGMLYGKVLRSPIAHGRILHIDAGRARSLPGVKAVIVGTEIELPNYSVAGEKMLDERLLAKDKVRYRGDEVALIAAVDEDTAEEALSLIKVEYEELPGVFDLEQAMQPDAPLVHDEFGSNIAREMTINHGDIEKAFAEADVIVEGRYETPRVHHGYLEPHAVVAQWDARGKVTFWIPTQSHMLARMTYANALGVGQEQVRVIQLPLGGGFGGKLEYKLHPLCALLARETGRPVKMVNTRTEELMASLPRVPMIIEMQLAARKDGTLLGKKARVLADNGAYMNYGPGILLSATTRSDNLYRIKNIFTKGYLIYTNKVPTGAFRGFGCPQSHFALETMLDKLAVELNMDPAELRLKNASQKGDITPHNWYLGSCGLSDCIKKSVEVAGWSSKRKKYAENKESKLARGIGIACCLHVSGNRTFLPFFDGSSAYVRINEEGRVTVFPGEVDIGQGSKTVFAIIAASELGIPLEWVDVPNLDTDINPHGLGTFGDRVTTLGGNAVKAAAINAREQLLAVAAEELQTPVENLKIENGVIYDCNSDKRISFPEAAQIASYKQAGATIIGKGSFVPPGVTMVHPETKVGNVSCAYPFVTQIAEVEVNRETGQVKLLNIVSAHDLGKAINPLMAEGQVLGAVAQGIGFALTEEMIEEKGIIKNQSFKHYNMPRSVDMPSITSILVESNDPNGPYGAKGLGEPALTAIAPAIANAIYHAVGVRIDTLPITPEKILKALHEKEN
ncbi:xanthine dehydrogenase family protein molybdopterin-binding subunit [Desulfallas sp. Bu1-1]|uniref:xanthine dehydrogenase family protein molybdopterin-binding subunit n=1 Tax=Desulfallas sp. Bu1-1 TaxID=2787620 RepID=UPI00189DD020|nr:xanthine dehydrogenase family protein molybdopterin-binding subunit [Desulfallas sp. Bu1-1]MBF7084467.1 xanthine dehydrogenase family protein molybdopterin-binding subunit [Desulfallas sp. Bu1-1]